MEERIQKIISASGLMSRRSAEEKIKAGKVYVNGAVASLGDKADPEKDTITVSGRVLRQQTEKKYIMLNKPKGFVTTMHDEQGRRKVTDLLHNVGTRVYPVGRLDMFSEGMLILTNDGEFANLLMHPSYDITKVYHVHVKGDKLLSRIESMRSPIEIDGVTTRKAVITLLEEYSEEEALIQVAIHEGKNRQIRRLAERAGLKIVSLTRISEGPLKLGNLKSGSWRDLTPQEIQAVRNAFLTENED